ncbi:MAG: hypothetical protein FJ146_00020 [Deltaproteobacteria bacterium]|nr:hypothetical protein [Deltaproteobacteria bacterium]
MKRIFQIGIVCAVSLLMTHCIHVEPLTQNDIQRLTTCRHTSLDNIRKSLILSGFEIKSKTATDLVTEYKQVGGYNDYRYFRRVTVFQDKPKVFRFAVREKTIVLERERPQQTNTNPTNATAVTPATIVNVNMRDQQPRQFENEFGPSYDESTRDLHEGIKSQVCGN